MASSLRREPTDVGGFAGAAVFEDHSDHATARGDPTCALNGDKPDQISIRIYGAASWRVRKEKPRPLCWTVEYRAASIRPAPSILAAFLKHALDI